MVYVLDSRMGEIVGAYDALAARPRTWREALERIAFAYRRFLVAHPNVLPLLVGRLPIGPHALTIRERSLAALTERGFSQELAARAFTTLLQYVVGSAVTQAGSPAPDEAAAIRDYYRSLDAAAYPHVAAAAEALTHTPRRGGVRRGPGDRARWHRSHPPAQRALAGRRRARALPRWMLRRPKQTIRQRVGPKRSRSEPATMICRGSTCLPDLGRPRSAGAFACPGAGSGQTRTSPLSAGFDRTNAAVYAAPMSDGRDDRARARDVAAARRDIDAAVRDGLVEDFLMSEREVDARRAAREDREAAAADRLEAAADRRAAAEARDASRRSGE